MRHYALRYENGNLLAIGTGNGGTEITAEEYAALLAEIREKAALVDAVYNGEAVDVPEEWREEIERRVAERIAAEGDAAQQEVSGEEFLAMLEEVL